MKSLSLKQKLNSISPLKIGFVASFLLHSSLFAFLVVDFNRVESIKTMPSQALSLSLENISGEVKNAKKTKKVKKTRKKTHRESPKNSPVYTEKQIEEQVQDNLDNAEDIAEDANDDVDSMIATSANAGDMIEILGSGDSLYAAILDIINKNRRYPKMARARGLQDKIQVEFILLSNGDVKDIRIISGRHRILNDDAFETIRRSAEQFPKPQQSKKVQVNVVYDFTI